MSIETYPNPEPKPNHPRNNSKALIGFLLLAAGTIMLLRKFELLYFPSWLIFPGFLIAVGVSNGIKHKFRNPLWFILISIGVIVILDHLIVGFNLRQFIWPLILIALGLWFILKRNHRFDFKHSGRFNKWQQQPGSPDVEVDYTVPPFSASSKGDDYTDATSIFGGVKKVILSKDFKGGEIVNVFGGCELDFMQADINGRVTLDVTQLFGGVKLIVPPHWQVSSELTAVFGGIDDKRFPSATPQSADKILALVGTSVCAGIDIRSY